jgi:hypothetical protein
MNRVIWLCLLLLFGVPASGQHRGGFGAGPGRGGIVSGGLGHGRFRGGVVTDRFGFRPHFLSSSGFFPYALPLFTDGYDSGYSAEPNVIIVQPPAPQVIVQQPPREVRSEIRDYTSPAPGPTAAAPVAPAEAATFVIALNDGSVRAASAVWVQDSVLHYVDNDDIHRQVPMKSVNRESTRKLNHERKLELWLPAAE